MKFTKLNRETKYQDKDYKRFIGISQFSQIELQPVKSVTSDVNIQTQNDGKQSILVLLIYSVLTLR